MLEKTELQKICLVAGALSISAGAAGMVLSFIYLASASMANIVAGTSGFLAGSILIGAGLVTCTIVATLGPVLRAATPEAAFKSANSHTA